MACIFVTFWRCLWFQTFWLWLVVFVLPSNAFSEASCDRLLAQAREHLSEPEPLVLIADRVLKKVNLELQKLNKDYSRYAALYRNPQTQSLPKMISLYQNVRAHLDQLAQTEQLFAEGGMSEQDRDEMVAILRAELEEDSNRLKELFSKRADTGPDSILLEINTVGSNKIAASHFKNMSSLVEMYQKFSASNAWKITELDSERVAGGLRSVTLQISGEGVGRAFSNEAGIHRFEFRETSGGGGKVYTSKVSVNVLPDIPASNRKYPDSEFTFDTTTSRGPGGQNVNKVETAVRVTHLESGLSVLSQAHKSQSKNKEVALQILRARLQARDEKLRHEEQREIRQAQNNGAHSPVGRVRTYDLDRQEVIDHRNGSRYSAQSVLEIGDLRPVINSLLDMQLKKILEDFERDLEGGFLIP